VARSGPQRLRPRDRGGAIAPLVDTAVSFGGPPAGLVVIAAFWLAFGVLGLVSIRLIYRAATRLGLARSLVVATVIALLVLGASAVGLINPL
jgi:hypothetical protein